jgi:hypothetical protein
VKSAWGACGLVAALVLGSGGLGCGEGVLPPGPRPADEVQLEEWDALPSLGGEDEPGVAAEWYTPSRSCQGLVPLPPGEGRSVNRPRESAGCLPGTSDGEGNLALGIFNTEFDSAFWTVFTPEGRPLQTFRGGAGGNVLMPQKSGFHVVSAAFGSGSVTFRAVSRTGALLVEQEILNSNEGTGSAWSSVVDPRGGSVVGWVRFPGAPGAWQVVVQRFGTSGEPRSPLLTVQEGTGTPPSFTGVGADTQGRALVLWSEPGTSALRGRWLRRNETFTSEFLVLPDATGLSTPYDGGSVLSPLIGGGLALRRGDEWVARIPSKKTSVEPAPGWLAARPGTRFSIVRGGRGYALRASGPGTGNEWELLAPAGNRCGLLRLPGDSLREPQLGRDGTAIAEAPPAGDDLCTYRYWPRLLH